MSGKLVDKAAMLVDNTTSKTFAEFVHCVRTKISVPSGGKCFCFARMGRGEGTLGFQVTGTISWGQNSEPDKIPIKVLPTKPPQNPRTIINLKEFLSLPESIK